MRPLVRLTALVLILGILVLMLIPIGGVPGAQAHGDKIAHVAAFLIMALALQVAPVWRERLGAALLAVLIGAVVEVAQDWVGRDRSLLDLAADAVGAGLAWLVAPRTAPLLDWLDER